MFKKISTGFGAVAIVLGIMMAAGSAGDCDGKCMEQANDLVTMLRTSRHRHCVYGRWCILCNGRSK